MDRGRNVAEKLFGRSCGDMKPDPVGIMNQESLLKDLSNMKISRKSDDSVPIRFRLMDNLGDDYDDVEEDDDEEDDNERSPEIRHPKEDTLEICDFDEEENSSLCGSMLPQRVRLQKSLASILSQPISLEVAIKLKNVVLGSAMRTFPAGWKDQSFEFSEVPLLRFGLVQNKGGPCGVMAALQAFIIKFIVKNGEDVFSVSNEARQKALIQSMSHILLKCASSGYVILAMPHHKAHLTDLIGQLKTDGITEKVNLTTVPASQAVLESSLQPNLTFFTTHGTSALIAFLYSCLLTRGLDQATEDMDTCDSPIIGTHGYCSQELVNLLICGRAVSNTFDGDKYLGSGSQTLQLKGISAQCEVGLLSLFEHYGSIIVGDFLKSPRLPIWLICSESHFSVLFSLDADAVKSSVLERRPIDVYYYDELAQQDQPICITMSNNLHVSAHQTLPSMVSPLEQCLRTKWQDAHFNWNGHEPLL